MCCRGGNEVKTVECVRLFSRASWGRKGEVELTGSTNQGVIRWGGFIFLVLCRMWWAGVGSGVHFGFRVTGGLVCLFCLFCKNHKDHFCNFHKLVD